MKHVVMYINQFFGQVGGEEAADYPPELREGPVGPAIGLNQLLHGGEITHTILCGDNYMSTRGPEALEQIDGFLKDLDFDLFLAGPAFSSGRYGISCGQVCEHVFERFHVPAVTSMNAENPGVEMFQRNIYIMQGGNSAAAMRKDLPRMAALANKLLNGEPILWAEAEGYYSRGIRRQITLDQSQTADRRAVDMLLKRLRGEPFETEMPIRLPERVPIAPALRDPGKARFAFVTTAGLVPAGNPDHIPTAVASHFGRYSIQGLDELRPGEWESIHGGYDQAYARENPMVLFALDAVRRMQAEGKIGYFHPYIYSTVGNLNNRVNAVKMADEILDYLKSDHIDAVIFGSA